MYFANRGVSSWGLKNPMANVPQALANQSGKVALEDEVTPSTAGPNNSSRPILVSTPANAQSPRKGKRVRASAREATGRI